MSDIKFTKKEQVYIEKAAEIELECHDRWTKEIANKMSDEELDKFTKKLNEEITKSGNAWKAKGFSFFDYMKYQLGLRAMIKRAKEVGGGCYCPHHDCRCEDCPEGFHD